MQCKEEIGRLESEMAKTMRVIIQRNVDTVRDLSKSTGLPMPDLGGVLEGAESEGLVAEALHKINLTVAQLKSVVAQREPVIKQIREVEEDFKEAHWHFVHQQDNLLNDRVSFSAAPTSLCLLPYLHCVEGYLFLSKTSNCLL